MPARKTRTRSQPIRGDRYVRRAHVSRRSRNRRKNEGVGMLASPWLFAIAALAITGLAYVSLIARCDALGKEISRIDSDIVDRERILQNEQAQWARMTAPGNIDRALAVFNLQMALPRPGQIVRVARGGVSEDAFLALLREQGGGRVHVADNRRTEIHE